MAKTNRNELVVGITVLVVLILTVYIVVALADWSSLFLKTKDITVKLPYKTGLKGLAVDSPILLGGTKIGQVIRTDIQALENQDPAAQNVFVYFTMRIPEKYPLRTDCLLAPESNLLGGQSVLCIKDLGSAGDLVQDGQTIDGEGRLEACIADAIDAIKREFNTQVPDSILNYLKHQLNADQADSLIAQLLATAADLKTITAKINQQVTIDAEKQSLLAKLHQIMESLQTITQSINRQLDTAQPDAAIARLNTALDKLNTSIAEIQDMVVTNKPGINQTVASLKNTAGQLEQNLPDILAKIKTTLDDTDSAMATAKATLADLKDLAAAARETFLINRDGLDRMVANLTEVSANLKLVSREVRRAPWKLLYKPKKGELHIQGLMDSAGDFASAAETLDSTSLRLRALLEKSGERIPMDKDKIQSMITELESTFADFQKAEEKFWEELE